jgi:RimJ/RimL family protein N-acetyltransferase
MPLQTWFPDSLTGDLVVLRRHAPENLEAFRRWYGDPEVARLTRYQDGPMRPDEIDRFFTARVIGLDSLTLAVHVRTTNRLIGSCAFSQLDGDNGTGLYHITIGEKDCWGQGYGTEATRLMLDHAFGALGLHRVGLTVFEFNERAIRSYRKVGFTPEGRAREAIWRDGRYWDEVAMSILEPEWRAIRAARGPVEVDAVATRARARVSRRSGSAAEAPASPGQAVPRQAVPRQAVRRQA